MNKEFEFTGEWFQDKKNQVHTIQDAKMFGENINNKNVIKIGEHL